MEKLKLKWVSDVIGEDYKKWSSGDIITIQAQTGTGKTYFIKNKLISHVDYFKKILILANRIELKRQLKMDLLKNMHEEIPDSLRELDRMTTFGNVVIMSYQQINSISHAEKYNQNSLDLRCYNYIICDECHFIMADGGFNNYCDYSILNIINGCEQAIKIFISATMEEVKPIIKKSYENKTSIGFGIQEKLYDYTTGIDYSYLDVRYFNNIENIALTIKNNRSEEKWLVFVTKIKDAISIKEILGSEKKVNIITKDTNEKDEDLNLIIKESKFKSDVLICTKALDNGVNISDLNVKNIVVMAWDRITFIQELGRLRVDIDNPYKINLYIMTRTQGAFRTLLNMIYKPKLKVLDEYMGTKNGIVQKDNKDSEKVIYDKFCCKYNRNLDKLPKDIIYLDNSGRWKINNIGHARLLKDKHFAEYIIERFKSNWKFAFILEQLSWIKLETTFSEEKLIEDVIDKDDVEMLENWLKDHEGKRLFADEQQELSNLIIKELVTIGNKVDYRTKRLKPSTIEIILRVQLGLPYAVSNTGNNINPKTKKKARWILIGKINQKNKLEQ